MIPSRKRNDGISFLGPPKDEELKKKWLINVRRENFQKQPLEEFFEKRCS